MISTRRLRDAVLRIRLGAVARLRRADAGPGQSGAVVDALSAAGDDAHGALARQLEIVLVPERLDRLIVGMADHQHAARHLVQRRGEPLAASRGTPGSTAALPDGNRSGASSVTIVRLPCSSTLSAPRCSSGASSCFSVGPADRRRPAAAAKNPRGRLSRARRCTGSAVRARLA